MGKTDSSAPRHEQQSMIIVPLDTPGVKVKRMLPVFGYNHVPHGHAEITFNNVRVPAGNIIWAEGKGFAFAQRRLGPRRIHRCMRLIGLAERALEETCKRVHNRFTFGKSLAEQGIIQEWIANSRIEIHRAQIAKLELRKYQDKPQVENVQ
jgi:acyl-CoA dehydrogenase